MIKNIAALLMVTLIIGCESGPTELKPIDKNEQVKPQIFKESSETHSHPTKENTAEDASVHEVVVLETLPTMKYVYLKVQEQDNQYWLATLKTEVTVGETYYFTGGLLKQNFESKEHNRVFDELLLVKNIVPEKHGGNSETKPPVSLDKGSGNITYRPNGTIPINDLVQNASTFENQSMKIEGKCTKVNNGIMGTNWLHIDDGTNNGFDFVATSDLTIAIGEEVVLSGVVAVNKDFGAGYTYAVLLEDCKLIH